MDLPRVLGSDRPAQAGLRGAGEPVTRSGTAFPSCRSYHPDMPELTADHTPRPAVPGPAPGDADEPAIRVLRRFRLVFNAVKTHFQQVEKRVGVGGAQLWALSIVHDRPGIGVNELAKSMDIRQSTASNLVKTLISRELVVATRSGVDRRNVQLSALPAGHEMLLRAPGPHTGVLPQALASLDAQTLERLDEDLTQLIAALRTDDRDAKVPLGQ